MSMNQFRAFLAVVIVVVLLGAGYLLWHDTHTAHRCQGVGITSRC